jgi:hypothetical protein
MDARIALLQSPLANRMTELVPYVTSGLRDAR